MLTSNLHAAFHILSTPKTDWVCQETGHLPFQEFDSKFCVTPILKPFFQAVSTYVWPSLVDFGGKINPICGELPRRPAAQLRSNPQSALPEITMKKWRF